MIVLFLCMGTSIQAKVTLPAFFTDNMIVQQNSVLTLPGKAKAGKQVTAQASWDSKKYATKAAPDGSFKLEISTPPAGGPYSITLSDGERLTLNNVLSGEVWFCSGQSNMEMPIGGWGKVKEYEQEILAANHPSIRLLQVKKGLSLVPAGAETVEVNGGGWQECAPSTVPEFSAVAYFYARELSKELNVPVGVIDCTWGGTTAEAWTSSGTLEQVLGFQDEMTKLKSLGFDKKKLLAAYQQEREAWQQEFVNRDSGFNGGEPQWISTLQRGKEWKQMELPGYWEGKGLNGLDGVVWFQKEIEIPASWEGKEVVLQLGMIDDEDITYYNGKEIARGAGCATSRRYTIPATEVKAGKGIITVRVCDFGGEGGIHGDASTLCAKVGGEQIRLAGSWNYCVGLSMNEMPPTPVSPESSNYPSILYNAMVHPLTIFPIKGVIWYQGESNVGRERQYTSLFQALIADWRKQWKQELPFYFVQLANYMAREEVQPHSKWAALREAQAQALHLDHTGMAVAIDIGEAGDIHPKNKQEVGRRLALTALSDTYRKGSCVVPVLEGYRVSGRTLILCFDHEVRFDPKIGSKEAAAKGFILAGPDDVFYPASAVIRGKEVILQSPQVEIPVAARYAWADNPDCSLHGSSGLPIAPFRTDK